MQDKTTFQVYSASAGSGKTYTLVKEYLKILLQTNNKFLFQNILAITFTNKAAAEMKERVIQSLVDFSSVNQVKSSSDLMEMIKSETGLTSEEINIRSKNILQAILQNYSSFQIKTIDSFTNNLVKSFAYDLGLSLDFEVEMDAENLLEEVIDIVVSKIGIDKELTDILVSFAKQKTLEDKSWNIGLELKDISKLLLNENHITELQKIEKKDISDFIALKRKLNKVQKEIEKKFKTIGQNGLDLIDKQGIDYSDFYHKQFPKFFQNLIFTPKEVTFESNLGLGKSIESQTFYFKGKDQSIKDKIDSVIESLLDLYTEAKNLSFDYLLNKLILKNLTPLSAIKLIGNVLEELKQENNIRLISEFNQIISTHLREQPAAFIYEKIGEKLNHFFIDEMQDTSLMQWNNLIPLIDNALSEENTSLLLVGDAKQAIYRWRGGEAEQFIDLSTNDNLKKNNPFVSDKIIKNLNTNYRSYSNIIDFNNQFFTFISKYFQNESYGKLYKIGNNQNYNSKKGGYVNVTLIEKLKNKEETDLVLLEKVYKTILDLDTQFDRNEICILVRKNKQGVAIADFLSERNVEIISSETLLIKNDLKVDFIINMINFLVNFEDDDSKFNALEYLYQHINIQIDKHDFISSIIKLDKPLFFKGLAKYGVYYSFDKFDKSPFYESIEEIIRSFKLIKESDAYIQFFLDFVFDFTQKKSKLNTSFLEYWDEKKEKLSIISSENKNAVQILTIHKAKGLEFPVVIYPYDLDIYRTKNPMVWYDQLDTVKYNNFKSILIDSTKRIEQTGSYGKAIFKAQKAEMELDNFNLLYVALTRAKEQLYIITEKLKSKESIKYYSQFFVEFFKSIGGLEEGKSVFEFGNKQRISTPQENKVDTELMNEFISSSWNDHQFNILPTSNLIWDENIRRSEAILYGNLIHEMMSQIYSVEDVEDIINRFIDNGMLEFQAKSSIKILILSIINHKSLALYFKKDIKVITEREIVTTDKQILIPDRLIFDKNKVTIIDYKTGKQELKHKKQIENYAVALENMGYKVVNKLLVYIGDPINIKKV